MPKVSERQKTMEDLEGVLTFLLMKWRLTREHNHSNQYLSRAINYYYAIYNKVTASRYLYPRLKESSNSMTNGLKYVDPQ
jgi:hypothetical protein